MAVNASADMPPELTRLKVRLLGVDILEKDRLAKYAVEREAGMAANAFTRTAISDARSIVIRDPAWGKWGGTWWRISASTAARSRLAWVGL